MVLRAGVQSMPDLVAYVDGGSLGNPGPAGVGVVIEGCDQGRITIGKWIGRQDNNVAEYIALLEALQCAVALKASKLHVYSDSEVVVRQMMNISSAFDHRVVDGQEAAEFIQRIKALLEHPASLFVD